MDDIKAEDAELIESLTAWRREAYPRGGHLARSTKGGACRRVGVARGMPDRPFQKAAPYLDALPVQPRPHKKTD